MGDVLTKEEIDALYEAVVPDEEDGKYRTFNSYEEGSRLDWHDVLPVSDKDKRGVVLLGDLLISIEQYNEFFYGSMGNDKRYYAYDNETKESRLQTALDDLKAAYEYFFGKETNG